MSKQKPAVVEHNGEQLRLIELSKLCGVPYQTLYWRYARGQRGEVLTRPSKPAPIDSAAPD